MLARYDDGRNTCNEARRHAIAPVHRSHPAERFMRDGDADAVVCEWVGWLSAQAVAVDRVRLNRARDGLRVRAFLDDNSARPFGDRDASPAVLSEQFGTPPPEPAEGLTGTQRSIASWNRE